MLILLLGPRLAVTPAAAQANAVPKAIAVRGTTTRDIPFTSHDGYDMLGRLTLPDTPGRHPVLVFVHTAEAQILDPMMPRASGESVPVYNIYRERLAALNVGFFSYDGRGISGPPTGIRFNKRIYDTSTLDNKVRDGIAAVRVVAKEAGADPSGIFLHGISEGTLLAAEIATRIPGEVKALALSGVIGHSLKSALLFMAADGNFLQHRAVWDTDDDGRISRQEFDADLNGARKTMPPDRTFATLDTNGDGTYTIDDRRAARKSIIDAIAADNFDGFVEPWLAAVQSVRVPDPTRGWLKDHLAQPPMWDLLARLTMPVGIFQGENDANTPAADVRLLEQRAKAGNKANIEFRYFAHAGHDIGMREYATTGTLTEAYATLFEWVGGHVGR